MTADRHFEEVLVELSPYLDKPPPLDSADHARFEQLIAEVGRHAALGPEHPHAEQIQRLAAKIETVTRRRDQEHHAHDLSPGRRSMTPMLGWDFHPRQG